MHPELIYGKPDRGFSLTATTGEVEVAPNETVQTWLYDGQYPGPELRVEEGERVWITVENDLKAETITH